MPLHFTNDELKEVKAIPFRQVLEAYGVTDLKRHGASDLVVRCPFGTHADNTPSFVVSPALGVFHCFGCGAKGDGIWFVRRIEQVTFVAAVKILKEKFLTGAPHRPGGKGSPSANPFHVERSDAELFRSYVELCAETFEKDHAPQRYMEGRGLGDPEMWRHFQIGLAARGVLSSRLPEPNDVANLQLRSRLRRIGILSSATGHEVMAGSVVIPIFDEDGNVAGMYGRKIHSNHRAGTPRHLYMGPHKAVWNIAALKVSTTVILTEAILDALSFWIAGHKNVVASYGVEGFTEHHLRAFKKYGTKTVLIAYDADDAGERGAESVAAKLERLGIGCYRIEFPSGTDANDHARGAAAQAVDCRLEVG